MNSERSTQQMRRQLMQWEKTFVNRLSDKELISKIYKLTQRQQQQTPKVSDLKTGRTKHSFFFQRRHRNGQQIHERGSAPLIREMQIKTTTINHLTLVRMAIHKKTKDKYWQGCVHAGKNVQCTLLVGV